MLKTAISSIILKVHLSVFTKQIKKSVSFGINLLVATYKLIKCGVFTDQIQKLLLEVKFDKD